ncbi:MAG: hypothetical protein HY924_00210 [Elusimicrobia bacterium]|nr:hypothetical protein [Elusimicrobiota bacterium]
MEKDGIGVPSPRAKGSVDDSLLSHDPRITILPLIMKISNYFGLCIEGLREDGNESGGHFSGDRASMVWPLLKQPKVNFEEVIGADLKQSAVAGVCIHVQHFIGFRRGTSGCG